MDAFTSQVFHDVLMVPEFRVLVSDGTFFRVMWAPTFEAALDAAAPFRQARIFLPSGVEAAAFGQGSVEVGVG